MSAQADLVEAGDRWLLPLSGLRVTRCLVDFSFGLELLADHQFFTLTIEQAFNVAVAGSGMAEITPAADPASVCPALALLDRVVQDATAFKDGRLDVRFSDGSTLTVDPHPQFEAWNLTSDSGVRMVALPGGGVASWPPRSEG